MENKPGVYRITNIPEGKAYIGSSNNIQRRFIQHRFNGSSKGVKKSVLYDDMKRLGIENFRFEVIEFTEDYRKREEYFIKKLRPEYNVLERAGNNMDNPEVRKKHFETLHSQEYINKIKNSRGFTKTEEFKQKVSDRTKKWWKENYELGCLRSKQAQSSEEYRKRRSQMAQEYKPLNREHQPNRKPIIMLDDNKKDLKHFLSIAEAVEYLRNNGFPKATQLGVRRGGEGGYRYKHYWKFEESQETIREE